MARPTEPIPPGGCRSRFVARCCSCRRSRWQSSRSSTRGRSSMTLSPISRRSGMFSLTAAVLIVLSQVMRLVGGRLLGPGWATTPAYTVTYTLALLGMGTLLLALTGLYTRESASLGRLGLAGYVTAFLGTLMVAGDWWFEAFAIPRIATKAPEVLGLPPSRSVLVGAIATVGLYTVGWTLFGIAAPPRPRLPPRRGSVAARRRTGGTACPVDAVPDPFGDRDRLDRPHPRVGISQPAHRCHPATIRLARPPLADPTSSSRAEVRQ